MNAIRTKIRRKQVKGGVRWFVAVVEADGKEKGHGGYATQREAKAAATALRTDASRGRYASPQRTTLRAYLVDEWLPSRLTADISENTRDVEQLIVRSWILPHLGDLPLQRITPNDVDRLYRTLRERGGRGGKGLSGKSVRNCHAVLRKALGDAIRRGHILANPVAAVDPPAADDSHERAAWTASETRRFLDVASSDRLAAIWRLLLASGLRRGELIGLSWSDIAEDVVTVRRQMLVRPDPAWNEPRVYLRPTTKNRKARRVRIDGATVTALRRWKAEQNTERLAFGSDWIPDGGVGLADPIVTEPDGRSIHPATLLARWKVLVSRAGVRPIPIHAARHTYGELAISSGVRLDVLSRQLGHSSVAVTGDIYLHDSDEAATDAAAKVGAILEGGR
jgi:integrase